MNQQLFSLGFTLFILGFFIIFISMIMLAFRGFRGGRVRGGGVFFIGPIPIMFGTDRQSFKWIILIALIITIILSLLFVYPLI